MLQTLRIKNLALVADLTLDIPSGLTVVTGETGAGKSIILGAIQLVLGQRADRTLIRTGADTCSVEAVFDVRRLRAPLREFLDENGLEPCEDHVLVLKRTFTATGANRQFVNGSPTSLATLGSLGGWLVDLHGPHDHQSLLHPARQLAILDAFGGLDSQRQEFAALVAERQGLEDSRRALIIDEATYARELDLLRFQVSEIEGARLRDGEDLDVDAEHGRAANAARLLELSQGAVGLLADSDESITTLLGRLGRVLQDLERLDPAGRSLTQLHDQAGGLLRELQLELSRYQDRIDLDPERLAQLEERLALIQSLKRKYGPTLADVVAHGLAAREKLALLESRDAELARLRTALEDVDGRLAKGGTALTKARRELLPRLSKSVSRELSALGFKQSQFDVALSPRSAPGADAAMSSTGFDTVEFLFAPNPGEPPRPLRAIASSGEMARVMLALKTVLAAEDDVPVLIFDEVDANVGGETARAVGEKMRRIARNHQVLCITHLAPVAAQGESHFVVSKSVLGGRTESRIEPVESAARVAELARMLGGGGSAATQHAEALLAAAR